MKLKEARQHNCDPNYTLASLLKDGNRTYLWGKYDKPFSFNIAVNDMCNIQNHEPTKYQFIGTTDVHDISAITYISSSAPDRTVKVGEVRRVRG